MEPWSKGHSTERACLSCLGLADLKPLPGCTEQRHAERFENKLARNNDYRRQRRAAARAEGTVYRKGRGNTAKRAELAREKHAKLRNTLFDRLGKHECCNCGFADKRALHLDHIDGGGRQHRESLPSGSAYYRALTKMPAEAFRAKFQILCANCNAIKREELEEWRWARASDDEAAVV